MNNKKFLFIAILFMGGSFIMNTRTAFAQTQDVQQLKNDILALQADVEHINLNLQKSKSKFQRGIFIATLGYTITIAGGLMLTEDVDAGRALLVTGGVTGGIGTYMLVDAFKFLGRKRKK